MVFQFYKQNVKCMKDKNKLSFCWESSWNEIISTCAIKAHLIVLLWLIVIVTHKFMLIASILVYIKPTCLRFDYSQTERFQSIPCSPQPRAYPRFVIHQSHKDAIESFSSSEILKLIIKINIECSILIFKVDLSIRRWSE